MPAQVTSPSTCGHASATLAATRSTLLHSPTSHFPLRKEPVDPGISSCAWRAKPHTSWPWDTRRRANSRPMPLLVPVMTMRMRMEGVVRNGGRSGRDVAGIFHDLHGALNPREAKVLIFDLVGRDEFLERLELVMPPPRIAEILVEHDHGAGLQA